jgi:hypothetical protein
MDNPKALYIVEPPSGDGDVQVSFSSQTNPAGNQVIYEVTPDGDGGANPSADGTSFILSPWFAPPYSETRQFEEFVATAHIKGINGQADGPADQEIDIYVISPVGVRTTTDWHTKVNSDGEVVSYPNSIVVGGADIPDQNNGFLDEYATNARWSQSKIADAQPAADGTIPAATMWLKVADVGGNTTYVFNDYIATYRHILEAGTGDGWSTGDMAALVSDFNLAADGHEDDVISHFQSIYGKPLTIADNANVAAAEENAYSNCVAGFKTYIDGIESGYLQTAYGWLQMIGADANGDPEMQNAVDAIIANVDSLQATGRLANH